MCCIDLSRKITRPAIIASVVAMLSLFAAAPAFAIKPYTLVEDGYPEATGQLEFENTFEATWYARNEHHFKEFAMEHELEYGYSQQLTLRVKGAYVYTDSQEFTGLHFDSAGVEAQYYFTNPNIDPIGISLIGAASIGERGAGGFEAFLVVQKDWDKWTATYNLGFATDIDNLYGGGSKETAGTLINSLGVVYSISPRVRIGGEISAESGYSEWRTYDNTVIYAGPVISITPNDRMWISAGFSYQVTNHADEPLYRAAIIIGYYF